MPPEHSNGNGWRQWSQHPIRSQRHGRGGSSSHRRRLPCDQTRRWTDHRGSRRGSKSWGCVVGAIIPWDQRSHSISFISSASMAGSSQRTPSPVVTRWRPICPSVMQRTNLSHGVSRPSRYVTHALAVL